MPPPPVLAHDYYLHNFQLLLNGVGDQYADLLSDPERRFIRSFEDCSRAARQLYVRLLSRKGEWFRRDKLSYPEIAGLDQAASELAGAGLLSIDPDPPLETLLPLLTKPELITLFALPAECRRLRRGELEQRLLAGAPPVPRLPFRLYRLLQGEHLACFKLLFFGNAHQDLTEFVLLDLGLYRYEHYPLDPALRLFSERGMIDASLQLLELGQKLEQGRGDRQALLDLCECLPPACPWPAVERRRARLLNRLARELERHNLLEPALALYAQSCREPARERQARILDKQGHQQAALALCQEILDAPQTEQEQVFAHSFSIRLRRKLGERLPPAARQTFHETRLTLAPTGEPIELMASAHYHREGQCFYCENSLMTALFGLTFWEAIFAPVAGAFFNRYQRGPQDLFSRDFYPARRQQLDTLLASIVLPDWPAQVRARFADKQRINNYLVDWKNVSEDLLSLAMNRIPRAHLSAIFRRMLLDLKRHRSGFPDLILFPRDGGYRLIEVKGPGDTLQQNQKRWLAWFDSRQIPAEVCYISWQEQQDDRSASVI